MKIAVIGAGGVGGYFGAKLARAGNEVTFLARNEHLSAMKTNGLTVRSFLGDFRVTDIRATVDFIDTFPPNATFSLTRDVWNGRPSEIDYQNGAVVHLAEKYGVDVPVNRLVYDSILPLELKARGLKN